MVTNSTGTIEFQINTPLLLTTNITVIPQTILLSLIPETTTLNITTLMTATFTNTILTIPIITTQIINSGTISNINYNQNNITFNWTPIFIGATIFQFTNITGNISTITSSNIMVYSTTTIVSINPLNNIYIGIPILMTLIFSEILTSLPIITPGNGTLTGASYTGSIVTFNWNPIASGPTNFQCNSVTGTTNTLISDIINVLAPTNIVTIVPDTATIGILTLITITFSNNILITSPTIQGTINGIITNINFNNNNVTFNWIPLVTGINNFQISNVTGTLPGTGTLTSKNITVYSTTVLSTIFSQTSGIYNGIQVTMIATFSEDLTEVPTIISLNGVVSGLTYIENILTFNWIPNATGIFTFQFSNVTGSAGTLTSDNITVLPQTTLTSISPMMVTNNVYTLMTIVFTNTLTSAPVINILQNISSPENGQSPFFGGANGTIDTINYNNNQLTFNWTPSTTGIITFSFMNITGNLNTITSGNISIVSTITVMSIISTNIIYNGIQTSISVIFSKILLMVPTIIFSLGNGTISNEKYVNNNVTFNWIPNVSGTGIFQFGNITGILGTLSSDNITVLPQTTIISLLPNTTTIGVVTPITITFNNNILESPTINSQPNNGVINNITYNNNNVTFNWTPSVTGTGTFQLNNITGCVGTIISGNVTIYSTTVVTSISPINNIYIGIQILITIIFSSTLISLPVITPLSINSSQGNGQNPFPGAANGTISNEMYSGSTVTFNWVPNATGLITFQCNSVTGSSGVLTTLPVTVLEETMLISILPNSVTNNIITQMTAIFTNNILLSSPIITPVSGNGVITNINYFGNSTTFNWTASNIGIETFQFQNVTGNSSTIISETIQIYSTTTIMSIQGNTNNSLGLFPTNPINNIYNGIIAQMIVIFSEILTSVPTILPLSDNGTSNNGTVSGANYTGSTLSFNWVPIITGITTFQFSNVTGTSATLISSNIIVMSQTVLTSISPIIVTNNVTTTIEAIFTNTLYISPTITTLPSNGTISNINYTTNYVTYNWISSSIGQTTFQFSNVTGNLSTITSNTIQINSTTVLLSITPINNIYNGIFVLMNAVFSQSLLTIPTITSLNNNGIISNSAYTNNNVTFNWIPSITGICTFSFSSVTGVSGTLTSDNITVLNQTTLLSISPIVMTIGVLTKMTAIFSNNILTASPMITILPNNGTITNISFNNNNVVFNWTPLSTGIITCYFNNVTGTTNTLTSVNINIYSTTVLFSLAPLSALYSLNVYNGIQVQMIAIFSEILTVLPTIIPPNGVVSGETLTNTNTGLSNVTFNWTPSITGTVVFQFSNVTNSAGTLTSNNIVINTQTTLTSITPLINYNNVPQIITAIFSTILTSVPTISNSNNGVINLINYNNNNLTFNWTPNTTGNVTFQFNNVTGTTSILTSQNLTVLPQTVVISMIPTTCYNGISQLMTTIFSNSLLTLPTINSLNGTISNETYLDTQVTFTWIPNSSGIITFLFLGVTGSLNMVASGNITVLSQTAIISILPTITTVNIVTAMTVVFSNNILSNPTITPSNGSINNINYFGSNVTFNWTPTTTGVVEFTFTNVTGVLGTVISNNITVISTTVLLSLSPINGIYNGIQISMIANFSSTILTLPTIITLPSNGIISNISYTSTNTTFNWIPNASGTIVFKFSSVTGTSNTLYQIIFRY